MDKLDKKILDLLQRDGSLTAESIGERIGLSKTSCWRRIQRLKDGKVIKEIVARLDPHAVNVGTTVFVTIKTAHHDAAWLEKFMQAVRDVPEVTEIYRMSGDIDYLLRIVVPDIRAYDLVYKRLIGSLEFLDVAASFSLETIKYTTALPMNYLGVD